MSALVRVVEDGRDEELQAAVDEAIRALLASVSDAEGLNTLMMLLLGWYVVLRARWPYALLTVTNQG
jgi:hypothetical protein